MQNIFVYGSLMFPEIVKAITNKEFEMIDFKLLGYKRYWLKDRNYPALVDDENSFVLWKMILNVDEKSLKLLDYFEWDEYFKKELEIDNKRFIVYLWKKELYDFLNWDWDEKEFKEKYLEKYVNDIIPKELENFK